MTQRSLSSSTWSNRSSRQHTSLAPSDETPAVTWCHKAWQGLGRTIRLEPGQALFSAGALAQPYMMLDGAIRLERDSRCRQTPAILFAAPGDLLGVEAFDDGPYTDSAIALTGTVVAALAGEEALRHPWLRAQTCRSLLSQHREMLALYGERRLPAKARLARALSRLASRFGGLPADDGIVTLTIPLCHHDLARHVGLSRVTVTQTLRSFARSEAIVGRYCRYAVSPARLAEIEEASVLAAI